MNADIKLSNTYTIREVAKISGLPESTLRYYETIGLINPIKRDASSKYRVYSEDDVNLVVAIACLNVTGLSIDGMRNYLKNRDAGAAGAQGQISLLKEQERRLAEDAHFIQLRLKYIRYKVEFWQAIEAGDDERLGDISKKVYEIADKMKLPKSVGAPRD